MTHEEEEEEEITSFGHSQDRVMARLYSVSQTKERITRVECDLPSV